MMFACEFGRAGKKLFTDTPTTMMCRDDETSDSANCRAVWEIGDEFGANQADDLACRLCNEKTASVAVQRTTEAMPDIRLLRRVAEFSKLRLDLLRISLCRLSEQDWHGRLSSSNWVSLRQMSFDQCLFWTTEQRNGRSFSLAYDGRTRPAVISQQLP